jgi:hypothetical protein
MVKKAGEILEEKLNEKSEEMKKIEVLEIDELHTYIKKNQLTEGKRLEYGLLLTETETKLLKL